jgi:hypothetical protein
MSHASLIHSVWAAGLVLQALLAGILLVKGKWRTFPVFTSYTIFSLLESGVGYAVFHNRNLYFATYVIGESVLLILGLAVVREIFIHLFSTHTGLRKIATWIFRIVVVLLVLLAVAVICAKAPIGRSGIGEALLIVEEAGRILQVGLIMLLFVFSSAFGLRWRQHVFGVALGLGMTTVGELLAVTMVPHVTRAMAWTLDLAHISAFDLSLMVWMGYLVTAEAVSKSADIPKRAQLEQWNQAVMELISQ